MDKKQHPGGNLAAALANSLPWQAPGLNNAGAIPTGDMPGDKVLINDKHVAKAALIFPKLLQTMAAMQKETAAARLVVSVYGGSGVGKSEIASLISSYLCKLGIGSYTLSGDNYPHRVPASNDAERLRIFRKSGMEGLISRGMYTLERGGELRTLQKAGQDADPAQIPHHPWIEVYQLYGRCGLMNYLGTPYEIDFERLSDILASFKNGHRQILLKRMGRKEGDTWYERVDFDAIDVVVVEWTHGNNSNLWGVDIPLFLYSTPEQTLEHRCLRARDKNADSPFTRMVLEVEAELLLSQAKHAGHIFSMDGMEIGYEQLMRESYIGGEPGYEQK